MSQICTLLLLVLLALGAQSHASDKMIVNPISERGADPWVVRHGGGSYYYCYSQSGAIAVNKGNTLGGVLQRATGTDWQAKLVEKKMGKAVWKPEPGKPYSKEIWAPELHRIGGRWYIYFAADDGRNQNHRMYVLESKTDDPLGEYTLAGRLAAKTDRWAIDGTVMQLKGKLYFIWSGWKGSENVAQDLYIARMKSATEIEGERVLISSPTLKWERFGKPWVNEGPEVLQRNGRTFIIYSASGSWTDHYCLGQLTLVGDDPMDRKSWRKETNPVFGGTKDVISPGHASFVQSPDGREWWIVYHAARHAGAGWDRNVRIQSFTWGSQGNPVFGLPVSPGVAIKAPSGEPDR